jgi:hypothetical protein
VEMLLGYVTLIFLLVAVAMRRSLVLFLKLTLTENIEKHAHQ